jgi:hypothetical protein
MPWQRGLTPKFKPSRRWPMGLGTGSTLKQPFTSIVEDYNFIRLPTQYPDEPEILRYSFSQI